MNFTAYSTRPPTNNSSSGSEQETQHSVKETIHGILHKTFYKTKLPAKSEKFRRIGIIPFVKNRRTISGRVITFVIIGAVIF